MFVPLLVTVVPFKALMLSWSKASWIDYHMNSWWISSQTSWNTPACALCSCAMLNPALGHSSWGHWCYVWPGHRSSLWTLEGHKSIGKNSAKWYQMALRAQCRVTFQGRFLMYFEDLQFHHWHLSLLEGLKFQAHHPWSLELGQWISYHAMYTLYIYIYYIA